MIRSEVTMQGLTAVDAFDGREGWSVKPFGGRRDPQRTSVDEAKGLAQDADIEGPLLGWRQKGHRVEYLGTEDVDGTAAHKLRVWLKDGDVQYVFLDPDYFLEIRTVTESRIRGVEQVTESDLGSYAQVEGVWIPFSIESGRKGGPRAYRVTVEQAEVNVEADDALFRFPTEGRVARAILPGPRRSPGAPSATPPAPTSVGARAPFLDAGVISGLGARNNGSAGVSGRISAMTAR